jgi:hypothetical protein
MISILKLEPSQTIPRPFARAVNIAEMCELIESYGMSQGGFSKINPLYPENINSENPVYTYYGYRTRPVKFFAFDE